MLEGEADAQFSLGEIWNLLQAGSLRNNGTNFCRQMINYMRAWEYVQKTPGSPSKIETIKQTHKIMIDEENYRDGKDVLLVKYRKSSVFADYHIFIPAGLIERYMEGAIFRFHETKKDDQIMATTNLLRNIINIYPFEDGNGRIFCLILAHALMQIKCWLFLVILSTFHRRGRKHYIRAVTVFDRKRFAFNALHTILKSLIQCWDNFKKNAKMLQNIMNENV